MADRILNVNGELIRLKDLADGSWAWATQLTGRRLAVVSGNYNQVLNVAAGANATVAVIPPAGELWRIKHIRLYVPVPTDGTTGSHTLEIRANNNNDNNRVYRVTYQYTNAIDIRTIALGAPSTKYPTNDSEQQRAILALVATNSAPLYFRYENGTDVAQTGTMVLEIVREVEYVVS